MTPDKASILIFTDGPNDAAALRLALVDDYPQTHVSTDPARFVADFDQRQPQVLLFACRSVEASEMHYVNLRRNSAFLNTLPHIALLLCDKDDARRAYALCRADFFVDYVLYWPVAHDAWRLPMAVHLALRALDGYKTVGSVAQVAAQARRIAELDTQLESTFEIGRNYNSKSHVAVRTARALGHGARGRVANSDDGAEYQHAGGTLEAVRSLAFKSRQLGQKILVVDDDEIMRKLLKRILVAEHFEVEAVGNAFAVLKYLQTEHPDLILMDVQMPSIDGLQLTRQLKGIHSYADIPIVMLSGQVERQLIVDCRDAGAADFVVKPFEREVLMKTVKKHIFPQAAVE